MPCTVTGSFEGDARLSEQEAWAQYQMLRKELDRVSAAACDAMRVLEQVHFAHMVSALTQEWWEKHQDRDRKRLRKEALSKLSREEIEALGLAGIEQDQDLLDEG